MKDGGSRLRTRAWRLRQKRRVALYQIEVGEQEIELARLYGGLTEAEIIRNDRGAIAKSIGVLLRLGLAALQKYR
jgi:hypothetical protein